MFRFGVDKHVTRQMGGWKRIDHMIEYLLLPQDLIKDRLSEATVLGENPLTMTNSGSADQMNANFDTIDHISYQVNSDEVNQTLQDRLIELGEKVDGVRVVVEERDAGNRDTGDSKTHDSSRQSSFAADFSTDDGGVTSPVFVAKAAYLSVIVTASWMATLAPLF